MYKEDKIQLIPARHSRRMNQSRPYICISRQAYCYVNKRAAKIIGLTPFDRILIYHSEDYKIWYLCKHPAGNCLLKNNNGTLRFYLHKIKEKLLDLAGPDINICKFYISPEAEIKQDIKMFYIITGAPEI